MQVWGTPSHACVFKLFPKRAVSELLSLHIVCMRTLRCCPCRPDADRGTEHQPLAAGAGQRDLRAHAERVARALQARPRSWSPHQTVLRAEMLRLISACYDTHERAVVGLASF